MPPDISVFSAAKHISVSHVHPPLQSQRNTAVLEKAEGLEGALIGLFHGDEANFTAETVLQTTQSAEDGNFAFRNLPFGTYIIRELEAPEGYVLSDELFRFAITEDGQLIELIIENEPKPDGPKDEPQPTPTPQPTPAPTPTPLPSCSQYSKVPVGSQCDSAHRINAEVILTLIADMLKVIAEFSKNDRAEFIKTVIEAQETQKNGDIIKKKKRLATAQKRASELEVLVCKIYEDSVLGKLPEARYAALDEQYAKEQTALAQEIKELNTALANFEKSRESADKFIALVEKYEHFDTMTTTMLNEFVEKIHVHERERKGSIETAQQVEIFFNFVGRYVPPQFAEVELTAEELEEKRKIEERKDRLHQNYLRRKASGKVAEDYERTKAKKKAAMDAKKNAIRAEDMAKGVFVPVSKLPKKTPRVAEVRA